MEAQLSSERMINIQVIDVELEGQTKIDVEQDVIESKTTKRNLLRWAKRNFIKCFSHDPPTRKVKETDRSLYEKIIWLLLVTLCFSFSAYLIWNSIEKWQNSPAIIRITTNDIPVWEIPFPAVTVCPYRKVKNYTFTKHLNRYMDGMLHGVKRNRFEDVSLICRKNIRNDNSRKFSLANETVSNIKGVAHEIDEVINLCSWQGSKESCENIFSPILTKDGICYTFNTIGPMDTFELHNMHSDYEYMSNLNTPRIKAWTPEEGYPPYNSIFSFPKRNIGADAKLGLQFILREMKSGIDVGCMGTVSGFKILLNSPTDLPRPSQQYIRVPMLQDMTVALTPKIVDTSDGLRVIKPFIRQCYFKGERRLTYFKIYTQPNCEFECLINYTYASCGCVHFSMPHGPHMKVCNVGSRNCTEDAEQEFLFLSSTGDTLEMLNCNCLPACTSIVYDTDISQFELEEELTERLDETNYKYARLVFFFKSPVFDVSTRSELYGTSDIIANCGGILGLFMGFSIVTVLKSLYMFILRAFRRCCQQRKIE